ncbi:MAG: CPBP family intramembrane glutamic endopeptidase [Candidatus Acidiferrales bacterium]
MRGGDPLAKLSRYRRILIIQVITISVVSWLWLFGGIPGARLGLCVPHPWLNAALALVIVAFHAWTGVRLRRKAVELRERLGTGRGALLPESLVERRWFAAVSIGGGVSEELLFRGFLFYYLSMYVPHINNVEKILLTSLLFGIAHLYQGWRGVAATSASGVILAGLYVLSGSLLLPIVFHATGNMRALLIFWPGTTPEVMTQNQS